jgi:hypothetical protein
LFIFKEDKVVEETFLSSFRPANGEFAHLGQQIKQEKNLTGDVLLKSH